MTSPAHSVLPDPQVCEEARRSRDARFDGLFFVAVTSTRIYCRPMCPAPSPKPRNVVYYPNAAAAESAGFRPCLRCRPELAPGDGTWRRGDETVARALKLIDQGALAERPLAELAQSLGLGERQLRRLFNERLGASPVGVHATRRLLFAKQLLTETRLPITQVALAAGYGSLTRFNTTFRDAYRMAPRDLRKRDAAARDEGLSLRLGYRPPYDFDAMLDFLRGRALPGVEHVDDESYMRVIGTPAAPGWLRVSRADARAGEHALSLELHGAAPGELLGIVQRLRRMFDLDADPQAIAAALSRDARLRPLLRKRPGLRLPSGWDGFEIAVRAIIGQQVSVAAARTLTARLAQRFGHALEGAATTGFPTPLTHLFPTPDALADADATEIGLTRARAQAVRTVSRALLDGSVDFRSERVLEDFVSRWVALPGIGPWTANYMALRALGHPDAFPAEDLVLQKAVPVDGSRLSAKALTARAEAWRPWRGYAVIHLWRESMLAPAKQS
ncbi:DNA-3-methyladenine glycosylase 2 family protein [Pseudoxanthomonas helianthi]|uniref:DNA-3-methyladenine glycosylase II n=1 Tax=Pseudoxanthomonas helianthi TaxID=1453541 RepID=A0A941AU56_9GAMM|nr:DNA-3-methyladenine glycosylase 2 [Pseudoxanthomonas helianthi]MBP3982848.1 DNA-3-methyladenine glycosylase 2 family protein [Pseudoxanthomonas helianthi]